jgi:hypothetical protein
VVPLVRIVLSKRIPKRSKLVWFANEPHIHKVNDCAFKIPKDNKDSSMDVDMIMNTMKNDTN